MAIHKKFPPMRDAALVGGGVGVGVPPAAEVWYDGTPMEAGEGEEDGYVGMVVLLGGGGGISDGVGVGVGVGVGFGVAVLVGVMVVFAAALLVTRGMVEVVHGVGVDVGVGLGLGTVVYVV